MHHNTFDEFLDDATHSVRAVWQERGGRALTQDEVYALNDALTGFFTDKRLPRREQKTRE